MQDEIIQEIIDCLPKDRTVIRYFRGRYAFMLLKHVVGEGRSVTALKRSVFRPLLDKPELRPVLAMAGQGVVTPQVLEAGWPSLSYPFLLTLGRWGSNRNNRDQTSRRGYNLVLQLNFSRQHDQSYQRMVKPSRSQMLNYFAHPVLREYMRKYFRETLAWARLDVDFATGSVLIEEIQSDWVRRARYMQRHAYLRKANGFDTISWADGQGKVEDVIRYCDEVLMPYQQIWDEAMLAMTIDFCINELGIREIYYHTAETGYQIKQIPYAAPPRSLYDALPRRFCFQKTDQAPGFLFSDRYFRRVYTKIKQPSWYRLSVQE